MITKGDIDDLDYQNNIKHDLPEGVTACPIMRKNNKSMFKKAYIEIINKCNLNCEFCEGHTREYKEMKEDEFKEIIVQVKEFTEYIYLHLFGEPLIHSHLDRLLHIAKDNHMKTQIVTNGVFIDKFASVLTNENIRKITFSINSYRSNFSDDDLSLYKYLDKIINYVKDNLGSKLIMELRLLNSESEKSINNKISNYLAMKLDINKNLFDNKSKKLDKNLYIGYVNEFTWATKNLKNNIKVEGQKYCLGLIDQFGVLSNGDIVPCCVDVNGDLTLGNIFKMPLKDILKSEKAVNICENFKKGRAIENLCKSCDFILKK